MLVNRCFDNPWSTLHVLHADIVSWNPPAMTIAIAEVENKTVFI